MGINLGQTKEYFRGTGRYLARHYWLAAGVLLLIVFLVIGFVFYKYIYATLYSVPEVSVEGVKVDEKLYQRVRDKAQEKNQFLQESLTKDYKDLFR